jgi:zinc protease
MGSKVKGRSKQSEDPDVSGRSKVIRKKYKQMKKILSLLLLSLLVVTIASAQLDRSQRPQPGPAPVIQLSDFESFTLDNGLKVIVVENHSVPVVSFQLTLDIDPVIEGNAKGYVDIGGSLLREGTTNRSKNEIDESIDFIGASLSTYSTGMFGSSLTRHQEALLDLMSDILLNPSFPESELQRMITQNISGISTIRSDASAMARNVATAVVYGANHPYGEVVTEESLKNVTVDLIKDYYYTYFRPNVAFMVIVGDIKTDDAKVLMNKYFGSWKPAEVPQKTYPTPQPPSGRRVAFADRTGAIQSVISVTYPLVLTPGHPDAIKVSVMNSILGGGVFSSRLIQNLREDKGWTYGAGSNIATDRLVGRFSAGAEVRNSVTDSTVVEIFDEMRRLIYEPVKDDDLQLIKNFMTGSFARSLESPRTIANFALNISRYNLPDDYYATYLEKMNAVTVEDVQAMAAKYIKPDNAIIVVAGNKDEAVDNLKRFSASGEVEFFDAFGRPVEYAAIEISEDVTADQIIESYLKALGGRSRLESINDMSQEMLLSIMGQQATIKSWQKRPNLLLVETLMGGMSLSKQLFDGKKVAITSPMGSQEFTEGPPFEQAKLQASLFPELDMKTLGVSTRLMGAETLDGQEVYRIEATTASGNKIYDYYSIETGLKLKSISDSFTSTFSDYKDVNGVLFPHKVTQEAGPQMMEMRIIDIQINTGLDDELFTLD